MNECLIDLLILVYTALLMICVIMKIMNNESYIPYYLYNEAHMEYWMYTVKDQN